MALDLHTIAGADGQQTHPDILLTGVLIWRRDTLPASGGAR